MHSADYLHRLDCEAHLMQASPQYILLAQNLFQADDASKLISHIDWVGTT